MSSSVGIRVSFLHLRPLLLLLVPLLVAPDPAPAETGFGAFENELARIGAAEVTLTPPGLNALADFPTRLEQALVLASDTAIREGETGELDAAGWQALGLIRDARSYSEAKMLARVIYGDNGPAPPVPREISENSQDPDWEFEDFNPMFPEFIVEALASRRKGRDRSIEALDNKELGIYAAQEEVIYRAQRFELARARNRAFDERKDLYTMVLNNGQIWRRKMPGGHVPSPVEQEEGGGGDGEATDFPELDEPGMAPAQKALLGPDTRQLRSRHNGHDMEGPVWAPHGAILHASNSSEEDPIDVHCTGVKIRERLVVSAGHCFFLYGSWNDNRKWVPGADGIAVAMGTNSDPSPNGYKNSHSRLVRGEWLDHEWGDYDFGIFVLHDNTSSCDLPWHGWGTMALLNETIYLYGYPGEWLECSASPLPGQSCHASIYGGRGTVKKVGTHRVLYDIDTQRGQSGSAFYRFANGRRFVAGVHRGEYDSYSNEGVWINEEVRDFINDARTDHPPDACD